MFLCVIKLYHTDLQMITLEEKVKLIRDLVEKHGITSYQIGQETEVSTKTAYNILTNDEIKPRNKTLNIILDYIENKIIGTEAKYELKEEFHTKNQLNETNAPNYEHSFSKLTIDEKINKLYKLELENSKKLEVISGALGKLLLDTEELIETKTEKEKK